MPTPSVTNAMKSLRGGPQVRGRAAIDVDLAGDEEEVVADAVEQDARRTASTPAGRVRRSANST